MTKMQNKKQIWFMVLCINLLIFSIAVHALDAFEYYIQGEDYLFKNTEENNALAIEAFENAVELDPGMSEAYTGLLQAYAQKYQYYDKDEKWYDLAIEAATNARTVDPYADDSPETYMTLARVYNAKGEIEKAQQEYDSLIDNFPEYKSWYPKSDDLIKKESEFSEQTCKEGEVWRGGACHAWEDGNGGVEKESGLWAWIKKIIYWLLGIEEA